MSDYIELEAFFDSQGVLNVRDKKTKAKVLNVTSVTVSNDAETIPFKKLSIDLHWVGKIKVDEQK